MCSNVPHLPAVVAMFHLPALHFQYPDTNAYRRPLLYRAQAAAGLKRCSRVTQQLDGVGISKAGCGLERASEVRTVLYKRALVVQLYYSQGIDDGCSLKQEAILLVPSSELRSY